MNPIKAGCDINIEPAWELCTGDPSIIVAVMDQGVMYGHEDLAANMWVMKPKKTGSGESMTTATDTSMTYMAITLRKERAKYLLGCGQ